MKRIASLIFFLSIQTAFGAPSVSSVSGTISKGFTLTIDGSIFGTKSPAKPHLYADFEGGSVNPTSSGTVTSWNENQGMTYNATAGYGGGGGVVGTGDNTSPATYTLRVDNSSGWTANGAKTYVYRKCKLNFDITDASQNTKGWRMWPATSDGNYPNIYGMTQNGLVNVEDGTSTGFYGTALTSWMQANTWFTNEIFLTASSAPDVKDGVFQYYTDGTRYANGNVKTKFGTRTANMTKNYAFHWVFSNFSLWSPSNDWNTAAVYGDEIYVDITYARVMLANSASIDTATNKIPQIPITWSSTQITAYANTTGFTGGSQAYIIVCDSNNSCSVGQPVTIDGSGSEGGGGGGGGGGSFSGGCSGDHIIDSDNRGSHVLIGG